MRDPRRRRLSSLPRLRLSVWLLAVLVAGAQEPPVTLDEVERLAERGELEEGLRLLDGVSVPRPEGEDLRYLALRWQILHRLRRFEEAERAGRSWIELAAHRAKRPEEVEALWSTGRSLAGQGHRSEAAELLQRSLERAGPDTPPSLRARVAVDLATLVLDLGQLRRAEELLDGVSDLAQTGGDPPLELRYLAARGTLFHYRGDAEEAIRIWGAAADLAEEVEGTVGTVTRARTLYRMSQARIALHDYAEAVSLLRRNLAIPETPDRARALISLGICHFELNQLGEAEEVLQEALAVVRASDDQALRVTTEAWAWGELGLVAFEAEDAALALERFERAVTLCRQAGDTLNEITWRLDRAMVLRELGRLDAALEAYRDVAVRVQEAESGRHLAVLYKGMGMTHAALGQDELAEARFHDALESALARRDSKIAWETEHELGRLYRRTDRPEEAAAAYGRALDAVEGLRGSLRLEAFKRDFFRDKVRLYEEAMDLLASEASVERGIERALAIAERARARAFLDSLAEGRARLHETLPVSVREREREILAEISDLQARMRQGAASVEAATTVTELERQLEAFHLEVRRNYPRFRELRSVEVASLSDLQSVLGEEEVALSYFLGEERSHLWVVDRRGLLYYPLPPRDDIEQAVRRAFAALLDRDRGAGSEAFERLSDLLLAPWLSSGSQPPQALAVIPSGILHFFPFDVLPLDGEPLATVARTTYVPSATTLVELRRRPTASGRAFLLALGDPPLGRGTPASPAERGVGRGESEPRLAQLEELGALPHTRTEVESVAANFGRRASTLLLGPTATEAMLKRATQGPSVVHLATHGWIDPSSAANSALVLGAGDGEDGLLQFREILRLPLAAELVTLSACQSALGELVTGEGLVGLARAFFYAGTDSVVASLWNVDDEASSFFMERFYRGLRRGLPKAEALRRARLETRRHTGYDSPYFWAPWVLLGQGEDGVAFPRRTGRWILGALGLGLLGLSIGLWRRRASSRATR